MEKSRQIWEKVPIAPYNISEKFRDFYRNLLPTGLLDMRFDEQNPENGEKPEPEIFVNPNANPEIMGAIRQFCESNKDSLVEIAEGIKTDDKKGFIVEMSHRLRLVALNETSAFKECLDEISKLISKSSTTIYKNAAMSYVAFYYFEHIQKSD